MFAQKFVSAWALRPNSCLSTCPNSGHSYTHPGAPAQWFRPAQQPARPASARTGLPRSANGASSASLPPTGVDAAVDRAPQRRQGLDSRLDPQGAGSGPARACLVHWMGDRCPCTHPRGAGAVVRAGAAARRALGRGGPEGLSRVPALKALPKAALGETARRAGLRPANRPCQQPQGLAVLQDLVGEGVQGRFGISGVEFCDDHHTLAPHAAACNR